MRGGDLPGDGTGDSGFTETNYVARTSEVPEVVVSAATLPSTSTPQLLVLPGF